MGQPGAIRAIPTLGGASFRLGAVRGAEGMHELHELVCTDGELPAGLAHVHRDAVTWWERRGVAVPVVAR